MRCENPIDAAVLAEYWMEALPKAEEEAVEEHLFGCDDCGKRMQEVAALAEGIRSLARGGSLRMVVTDGFLERAAAEGLRVRAYAPPAGGGVQCTVTAEDDILVGRLAADLSGVRRVDVCLCDEWGVEQARMADIPFHAGAGSVVLQESITYAKAAPSNVMIARLVAVEGSGEEKVLGEYTFDHKRSMPGEGER